jgi:hypothetical protein
MAPNKNDDEVIKDIKDLKKKLNTWATQLQVLAVLLPLTAIILSAIIGSFVSELDPAQIRLLAFLSALFGVVSTTFQIEKRAKDMRDAFRYLNYSIYKYILNDDLDALIEAYNRTESMVGHVQVTDEEIEKIIASKKPST